MVPRGLKKLFLTTRSLPQQLLAIYSQAPAMVQLSLPKGLEAISLKPAKQPGSQ